MMKKSFAMDLTRKRALETLNSLWKKDLIARIAAEKM